jgi:hypothetical protein
VAKVDFVNQSMVEILCNQCQLATRGVYGGMFDLVGLCGRFLQYLENKKTM